MLPKSLYNISKNKTKKKKLPKSHKSTMERTRPDHAISSAVTFTKLPPCYVILKRTTTTTKRRIQN